MQPSGLTEARNLAGTGRLVWVMRRRPAVSEPEQDQPRDPESEWVTRALRGDATAFDRLVEAYAARIHTHLYRLVGNREDAEDLAQETFVRVYRFLDRFDSRRPLRSWLYAIATRVGLNALRSRRRRLPSARGGPDLPETDPADPREDARRHAVLGELEGRVSDALKRLPPRSALLVHLHYREGLNIAEAAEIVGMTEGAAKVALHRARQSLREWLIEDET